jgi:hypothetical protein
MIRREMSNEQYGLFFDVRRSIRYHDRRRAFFERMHQLTGVLTVLLAGSVLFDIARPGDNPAWLLALAAVAAVLSAFDLMVGYATKAGLHRDLKSRFGALEMSILSGDAAPETWQAHQLERLRIEQDEPPVFRALDLLCHNELLRADGFDESAPAGHFAALSGWQRVTRHLFHWADLKSA